VASKEELPCLGLYLCWYSTSEMAARMCTPPQEGGHYLMGDARGRSETGTFLCCMQRLCCVENTHVSTFKFIRSLILTTGPQPLPNRVSHKVQSSATFLG